MKKARKLNFQANETAQHEEVEAAVGCGGCSRLSKIKDKQDLQNGTMAQGKPPRPRHERA